jgi:VWFA-related protein
MWRLQTWFATTAVTVLLASLVQPQTAQDRATPFTSSAELVLIPTVVNDKSGNHISGLTKAEFVLKQDGKSQPIAVLEEVNTSSTRGRRSAGEQGTFSNFEPGGGSDYRRLNIIVLDFVNTPFPDLANARSALLKFLSEAAESGEPMCLLALTRNGLILFHDFTDDPKLLAAALRQAQPNNAPLIYEPGVEPGQFPGTNVGFLIRIIRAQLEGEARMAALENKLATSITVDALQQIAKAFRGLPGRKSLIWASSGFPILGDSARRAYPRCTGLSLARGIRQSLEDDE